MRRRRVASRVVAAILSTAVAASPIPALAEEPSPDVALVVLVVVDQLGWTYLDRYRPYLTAGFGPLMRSAAVYTRGVYAYANTETAPGHATISTGTWPSVHGITGNHWYDPASGEETYCFADPDAGRGPRNLRATTLADTMTLASGGRSRVVSVSQKDRAAIALGGHTPLLASWYDKAQGRFVAGAWKGARPAPAWFNATALAHLPADTFDKTWDRLLPSLDYAAIAGPDDLLHEELVAGFGRVFPRKMGEGTGGPTSLLWKKRYVVAPQALEAVVDIALVALEEERLGRGPATDMLALSLSSLDYAGHHWGTHSQEAFDMLLRIDRQLGRVKEAVDRRVGQGRVLWVLTADHGATPTVETSIALGLPARRIDPSEIRRAVDDALKARKNGMRLLEIDTPRLFLSPHDDEEERVTTARAVAKALRALPFVEEAYASADLAAWPPPFGPRFRRSWYPSRDGDVLYRICALCYPSDYGADGNVESTGSGHGSPYTYDAEVPIVLLGPGVRRGEDRRPYAMTRLAPTIAAAIGILPPAAALDAPLPAVAR